MQLVPNMGMKRPNVPEIDFVGTIVTIAPPAKGPPSTTSLQVGQRVYGLFEGPNRGTQGTLCEYITIDTERVSPVPSTVTLEEAAGLAAVGVSSILAFENAKVQDGQSVFILGGKLSLKGLFAEYGNS